MAASVGTGGPGGQAALDAAAGRGVEDAGEHRDAAPHRRDHGVQQGLALAAGQQGEFAGRSEREDAVYAARQQVLDQRVDRRHVDLAVVGQRRTDRRDDTMQ